MTKILPFLIVCAALLALPASPRAQDGENQDAAKTAPSHEEGLAELERKSLEIRNSLSGLLDDISSGLDNRQRRHFNIIYNNHNLIATVKEVRKDVGAAVKACGENNPEISEKISRRFENWKGAVNAKIQEAEGRTTNMILAQNYTKPDNIRKVLDKADEVREHSQTIYKKVPVTSLEACEYLHNKMDETENNMIMLLDSTLISVPQEMQKADEEEEEQENAQQPEPGPQEEQSTETQPEKTPDETPESPEQPEE